MPQLRIKPEHQLDVAIEELEMLTSDQRGLSVTRAGPEQVTITVGRHHWPAGVITRDAVSLSDAQAIVTAPARGATIIVANQLSAVAKDFLAQQNEGLQDHGWSWLDRRGELQLNHPTASGVVHFDTSSARRSAMPGGRRLAAPRSDGPIRGRAGISCAAALLLQPAEPPSIRAIARQAQMSHGAIGEASKLLREVGLIRSSGQPQIPELFWALAAVWSPTRITPVATLPTQEQARRLHANVDGPATTIIPGWCLGGDESLAAWGAPVFSEAARPWIWVIDEGGARRAERVLTPATWEDYTAVIAVPPTPLVSIYRQSPPTPVSALPFLPTAHPLFLALELAQDPTRGHEILDDWQPEAGVERVW